MTLGDRGGFEVHRDHLHAVAYRMLGTDSEADDAVQEAWIRFSRSDTSDVDNLGGWLTTVVSRVCLDMLRTRASRPEEPAGARPLDQIETAPAGGDPELEALVADSLGPALLVVLNALSPAERIAFVLHDMFAVSFDDVGAVLDRSTDAAKQLASRARRKVRGAEPGRVADPGHQRAVVDAFLAAARNGDVEALLALLDPDAVVRTDSTAVQFGALKEVRGAAAVAESFAARAHAGLQPVLIDGGAGAAWVDAGTPRAVFEFTIAEGRVAAIDTLADPDAVAELGIAPVDE